MDLELGQCKWTHLIYIYLPVDCIVVIISKKLLGKAFLLCIQQAIVGEEYHLIRGRTMTLNEWHLQMAYH